MRYTGLLISGWFFATMASFCKKDHNPNDDCFANSTTVRILTNTQATVKKVGDKFYIVEQGAIDTKLNPCPLTQEFQIDNLSVIITGEVKSTIQGGPGPCCTENFLITKISK